MAQGFKMVAENFCKIKEPKIDILEGDNSDDTVLPFNTWMTDIDM